MKCINRVIEMEKQNELGKEEKQLAVAHLIKNGYH